MDEENFEELILIQDKKCGLKGAICLHSTARGPALGGTRLWPYSSEEEAVNDVMCLARGMSYKAAAAELPLGGGKGVIIGDPVRDKNEELFRAYGRFVERLNGRFITAADMGTDEKDLDYVRMETNNVVGGTKVGSPSPFTAYGVWKGIKACADDVFHTLDLEGMTIAVQGTGSVGAALCGHLAADGARLVVTDINEKKVKPIVERWGAKAVKPEEIYNVKCDIFAPCGAGGVINEESLPRLKCRIVAGAANNVIKESIYFQGLAKRGILYAPDYIINAGGLIFVEFNHRGTADPGHIKSFIDRIGPRLKEIFRRSREENRLPHETADLMAEENLTIRVKTVI
ncbi:MAG TPA: Glu/Leu/Phe/Val dehydrogenase [Firmicutes bacterium]|nr:Glu/Leu/Phe/Val dehydrogenase [Bacillota bacterium]